MVLRGAQEVLGVLCLSLFSFTDLQDAIQNDLQEPLATLQTVHRRIGLGLHIFQTHCSSPQHSHSLEKHTQKVGVFSHPTTEVCRCFQLGPPGKTKGFRAGSFYGINQDC